MVELTGCYTDEESQRILQGAAAYDRECEAEIREQEETLGPLTKAELLEELYTEFERINLECIRTHSEGIAINTRILEGSEYSQAAKDRARCQIHLEVSVIEDLRKDIANDRQTLAELKRLSGK